MAIEGVEGGKGECGDDKGSGVLEQEEEDEQERTY